MLAWSEGTDNGRQKTRNHGYDVIVGGELFWWLDHPRKLVTLEPKTQSTGASLYPASFPLVGCHHKRLAWKTSLRKVRTLALQQIEAWRFTMIDRGDIRQAIDRCSNISNYTGRWLWSVQAKADSLIAKFKEAGGTVREMMYEQSHRDYLRSGYLHHHLPVMGC